MCFTSHFHSFCDKWNQNILLHKIIDFQHSDIGEHIWLFDLFTIENQSVVFKFYTRNKLHRNGSLLIYLPLFLYKHTLLQPHITHNSNIQYNLITTLQHDLKYSHIQKYFCVIVICYIVILTNLNLHQSLLTN